MCVALATFRLYIEWIKTVHFRKSISTTSLEDNVISFNWFGSQYQRQILQREVVEIGFVVFCKHVYS